MGLLDPKPPPYDPLEWAAKPLPEKARMVCQAWAVQGYGTPPAIYALYALKVAGYIAGWVGFCSLSPELGGFADIGDWWSHPIAFQKAIAWSMLFEILGLGCGSGPLTGRYMPPIGGFLYWLRPGTTKLPLFEGAPFIGRRTRGPIEVLGYAAILVTAVVALVHPSPGPAQWWPLVALVPALGVLDKTLFLAARGEHYWVTIVCFAAAPDWIAGAMAVQLALWFFAGVSKLNHHFPAVVCVMTSNSPVARFAGLRKLMYRRYPDDLNPSRLAIWSAHIGTALELGVPIVLLLGDGGSVTAVGLVLMVVLHAFITSNVPMGVPIEWNVMVVYGGFFLFGAHAGVSLTAVGVPLGVFLIVALVVIPLAGNLVPRWISFLLAMRYYAGNWACSVWLFRSDAHDKLDRLIKSSPLVHHQLGRLYDEAALVGLFGKVIAFRLMHLHGRALPQLVPQAIPDDARFEDYDWIDGEVVAGLALGWNFGEGHLHDEQLLRSIQAQCGFEPGELRCIFIESQPLHRAELCFRIHDAAGGLLQSGTLDVGELRELQPWPTC